MSMDFERHTIGADFIQTILLVIIWCNALWWSWSWVEFRDELRRRLPLPCDESMGPTTVPDCILPKHHPGEHFNGEVWSVGRRFDPNEHQSTPQGGE